MGQYGYYYDEETGSSYIRARVYSPTIGRWASADPLGFADGSNVYLAYFVPGEVDPSGYAKIADVIKPKNKKIDNNIKDYMPFPKRNPKHPVRNKVLNNGFINWPEPVTKWPKPEEFEPRVAAKVIIRPCLCKKPQGNQMRPPGLDGKWPPIAGLSPANCKPGDVVFVRYEAACKPNDELKGKDKKPCVKCACWEYISYKCKKRKVNPRSKYPKIKASASSSLKFWVEVF